MGIAGTGAGSQPQAGLGPHCRPGRSAGVDGVPSPRPSRHEPARVDDRPTGRVIRRYEHDHPGDLVHIDTKKLRQRFTQRYRPQTNGKVERFNRTLLDEWAYVRAYRSEAERRRALDNWLHLHNHHRSHTALGGHPPITRVNNPAGHYN